MCPLHPRSPDYEEILGIMLSKQVIQLTNSYAGVQYELRPSVKENMTNTDEIVRYDNIDYGQGSITTSLKSHISKYIRSILLNVG